MSNVIALEEKAASVGQSVVDEKRWYHPNKLVVPRQRQLHAPGIRHPPGVAFRDDWQGRDLGQAIVSAGK